MSNTPVTDVATQPKDRIVVDCLATPPADWSPNIMAVFVDRLEYALFEERKGKLVAVSDQLESLMQHVLSSAPDALRRAIIDDKGDPAIRMAFLLGNLSFAHQFASSTAHRRPDDAFFTALDEPTTKTIVACLLPGDRTRPELAERTGLALDVVNAKMRELTGLGIVDFRHRFSPGEERGVPEYFLTPAAKQLAGSAT